MPTPKPAPDHLTALNVFMDSPVFQKAIMVGLLVATVAALVILVAKLAPGRRLAGGSPFLSGLRFAGPIISLLGACSVGLNMTLGVANIPMEPNLRMFAPGVAESFLMVGLGFLAGAVASVGHWLVEAKIDRQVLSA